jgi:hypothetical protein
VENIVGQYQCGLRKGKSKIDQIQSMQQILEKTSEYRISMFDLFVGFKAACDTI